MSKSQILVVLSSARFLTVYPDAARQRQHRHPTGYFLSELAVPGAMLENAGYELIYASPSGDPNDTRPDPMSVSPTWFGTPAEFDSAIKKFVCVVFHLPFTHVQINDYAGVFMPGGHAPMEDLAADACLGSLLADAHGLHRPIGAMCHGPAALLSAGGYFQGYQATCFSKAEEQQEEPGGRNDLGGYVPFYLDEKLEERGLQISARAPWKEHVVVDRGLVTGQNPMSDKAFGKSFLELLV